MKPYNMKVGYSLWFCDVGIQCCNIISQEEWVWALHTFTVSLKRDWKWKTKIMIFENIFKTKKRICFTRLNMVLQVIFVIKFVMLKYMDCKLLCTWVKLDICYLCVMYVWMYVWMFVLDGQVTDTDYWFMHAKIFCAQSITLNCYRLLKIFGM